MSDWQRDMTVGIGERVKTLRGDRTAVWLSERTEQLGMKISRSAISELESGKRRSISVAELLTLAAALDVPPALLLFPQYPDGPARPLPGLHTRAFKAVEWISGRHLLMVDPDPASPSIEPFPTRLVGLVGEREGLFHAWLEAVRGGKGSGPGTPAGEVLERRSALNRRIEEAGGVVGDGEG